MLDDATTADGHGLALLCLPSMFRHCLALIPVLVTVDARLRVHRVDDPR